MRRPVLALLLLSVLFACFESRTDAQDLWKRRRYEISGGVGPTFFFGDVGGFSRKENILGIRDLSFLQTRIQLNAAVRYRIMQDIALRISLTPGTFRATDARGSNIDRGYEASITFFEPAVIAEYYFIKNTSETNYLFVKGKRQSLEGFFHSLDFYALAGFGGLAYSIKPNAKLAQTHPKTSGFTEVLPVGVGATMIFSPEMNFGVEIGGRYSFSDNLDGFTSQYSSSNDVYYFLNLSVTYKIRTGRNGLPLFFKKR